MPRASFRFSRSRSSNTSGHHCERLLFTPITQSSGNSRRKLEAFFDQTSLPFVVDSSWNQWKHLLGTKIGIKATFVQSGKYQQRAGAWHLAQWETALPSRLEVALPSNIAEQIAEARQIHHRFGEFAEALDL